MRKTSFMLGVVGALALCSQVKAVSTVPTFPGGPWTFDIEDRSSLYYEPGGVVTPLPAGSLKSVGAAGLLGFRHIGVVDPAGHEVASPSQRTVFRLKDVNTGTIFPLGDFGMKEIKTDALVDSWEVPGREGTGAAVGLKLSSIAGMTSLPAGSSAEDNLGTRLWFSPDARVGFTDLIPSLPANFGLGNLNAAGLATAAGGFGGLVELYADLTPDATFANGIGDAGWSDVGGAFAANPTYPMFDSGADGSVLVAVGVFTPLYAPNNQTPADPALFALLYDANFGAGSYAAAKAAGSGAVLIEDFTGPGGGSGVGFLNIIDAVPAFLANFTPDWFGPGRDLRVSFQTSVLLGADLNGNGLPDQFNIVDGGVGPGWNIASTDPVQGYRTTGIPEPVTAAFSVLGLAGVALAMRRRR